MGHRIEHSATHTKSVAVLHAAFTSDQFWNDRLAEIGGPGAKLVDTSVTGDTYTANMIQGIAERYLPPLVTKIRHGDLRINRRESWGPVSNGSANGTFRVTVDGAPAVIDGKLALTTEGTGSKLHIEGNVKVDFPLFGGRIEEAIGEQLNRLNDKEDEFTERWTTTHS
ncbi:DUF2505 domain-containing protein [Antrihabitans stalactiti]|uniref:DUF2505 domain-containing protein n=1 Tax=Antrihabitans stalactiti TaxID=2584121 RepID=A0A848KJI7_9NOCA|nr:DUF2505 domain-containing protein [Antrihabitans stalactiti]NMN97986.1 DUF2505 domain-containing protein [Antrihabitans stalactiti]